MIQNVRKPVLDFSHYISERTQHFTAREWVFKAIDNWLIDKHGPRFFLLEGEPGSGKTAIAARLSQISQGVIIQQDLTALTRNIISAVHFCNALDTLSIDPIVFVNSVATQLANCYPDYLALLNSQSEDRHIHINVQQNVQQVVSGQVAGVIINVNAPAPESAFNRAVREPLETLLRTKPDEQVIFLVDALDEALTYSGISNISALLARLDGLSSHVRFILTTRPEEKVMSEFTNAKKLSLSIPHDQRCQEDISRYVQLRLREDSLLAEKFAQVDRDQVARLTAVLPLKADGNFQFVRFLLDSIAKGLRRVLELEGLPPGLDSLYFDSLKRVDPFKRRDWFSDYRPLLGILAVAQESLTLAQLRAFTSQSEEAVWQYLGDLQQFIKEIRSQDEKGTLATRYRLFHESFHDFLHTQSFVMNDKQVRNRFFLSRVEWHNALIARYGASETWGDLPEDDSGYGLRWLAWHLHQAGRMDDLRTLLLDATYLQNKIGRLRSESLASDFQLVVDDANITLLAKVIALSHHILDETPNELPNQVMGRAGRALYQLLHHWPVWSSLHFRLYSQTLNQVGSDLVRIIPHASQVNRCVFSSDGRYALSASGHMNTSTNMLQLWDVQTGELLRIFEGHKQGVNGCAFSPDGRYALSAGGHFSGSLKLWDVQSREELRTFGSGEMDSCAFSPDGQYALGGGGYYDKTLKLWNIQTGKLLRTFRGHNGGVNACAFSPDGRYALSASNDRTMRLWDVQSGEALHTFERFGVIFVEDCAFSPDGQYALSASFDTYENGLTLWDIQTGKILRTFRGHKGSVRACAFSPDGQYALSASSDRTVRLWNVQTGEALHIFRGHTSHVNACAFSPDGRYVLSGSGDISFDNSSDNTMRLWNVQTAEVPQSFQGHTSSVNACAFSPDGRYALSASSDNTLKLWDVQTGEELHTFQGHRNRETMISCAFSPDGRYVLGSSNHELQLWNVQTGEEVRTIYAPGYLLASAYSPDGRHVLGAFGNPNGTDNTLRLWDVQTRKELHIFEGHSKPVNACAFSPDGQYALSASSDGTVRLWNVQTGEALHIFRGHTTDVITCAFSPDGRFALSGSGYSEYTLRLWDVQTRKELHIFELHSQVNACAFSPDSRYALSVSNDHTLRLWNLQTAKEVMSWSTDKWPLTCLACHHNEVNLVTGDAGGNVHFLKIESVDLGKSIP